MDVLAKAQLVIDEALMDSAISFEQLNALYEREPDFQAIGLNEEQIRAVRYVRSARYAVNITRVVTSEMRQLSDMMRFYCEVKGGLRQ